MPGWYVDWCRKQLVETVGEQEAAKLYPKDSIPEQGRISPGPPTTAASSLDLQEPSHNSSTEPHPTSHPAAEVLAASPDDGSTNELASQMTHAETGLPQPSPASASTPEGSAQEPDGAAMQTVSEQPVAMEFTRDGQADAPESATPAKQQLHGKEEQSQSQAGQPVQLRLAKHAVPILEGQKPEADDAGPNGKATALEHVSVELVAETKAPSTGQTSTPCCRTDHHTCQYIISLQDIAVLCTSLCCLTHCHCCQYRSGSQTLADLCTADTSAAEFAGLVQSLSYK